MTAETEIIRAERDLHAAKGILKELKNNRWIAENYRGQDPSETIARIRETEKRVADCRAKLAGLYVKHLKLSL
jgi:hypothetical protein